jgi:hypothetical protein
MSKANVVRGSVLGAGVMYFLDPVRGARRRAVLAGRVSHVLRTERALFDRARRDVANKLRGAIDQLRRRHRTPPAPVTDDILELRVRSRLGHCASHARAVLVDVVDGHVTLAGPILSHEAEYLISEIAGIGGVKEVLDALDRHKTPEGVPALQGEGKSIRRRRRVMWSPVARLLAVATGSALVTWGLLVRRGTLGMVVATAGGALVARGTVNRPLDQLARGAVVRKHRARPSRKRGPSAHILH